MSWHDVDMGNLPGWLGALGTPATILFALKTLRTSQNDAVQNLARQVFVTAHKHVTEWNDGTVESVEVKLAVTNTGPGPIYDVVLYARGRDKDMNVRVSTDPNAPPAVSVNGGGGSFKRTAPYEWAMLTNHFPTQGLVVFRDANGRRWLKSTTGDLIEEPAYWPKTPKDTLPKRPPESTWDTVQWVDLRAPIMTNEPLQ